MNYEAHHIRNNSIALKEYDNSTAVINLSHLRRKATDLDVEALNTWAVEISEKVIKYLDKKNIHVKFLNPSYDGGVVIEFDAAGAYFLIEIFNDQDIVLLKREKQDHDVYDTTKENIFKLIDELV